MSSFKQIEKSHSWRSSNATVKQQSSLIQSVQLFSPCKRLQYFLYTGVNLRVRLQLSAPKQKCHPLCEACIYTGSRITYCSSTDWAWPVPKLYFVVSPASRGSNISTSLCHTLPYCNTTPWLSLAPPSFNMALPRQVWLYLHAIATFSLA